MSEVENPQTIAHPAVEVEWKGTMQFDAGRPDGIKVRIDGDATAGPGPFDLLLAAVATCASTDVLVILDKQRTPVEVLVVRVEAQRVNGVPRRLGSAALHFTIKGSGVTQDQAERAVEIAITKYCSVRSSLIADAPVSWTVELRT